MCFKHLYKKIFSLLLILALTIPANAAISVSDGSAFVSKSEFATDINNLSNRMAQLENSLDGKIDSLVSSYLSRNGIWNGEKQTVTTNAYNGIEFAKTEYFKYHSGQSEVRYGRGGDLTRRSYTYIPTNLSPMCLKNIGGNSDSSKYLIVDNISKSGLLFCNLYYGLASVSNISPSSGSWYSNWSVDTNKQPLVNYISTSGWAMGTLAVLWYFGGVGADLAFFVNITDASGNNKYSSKVNSAAYQVAGYSYSEKLADTFAFSNSPLWVIPSFFVNKGDKLYIQLNMKGMGNVMKSYSVCSTSDAVIDVSYDTSASTFIQDTNQFKQVVQVRDCYVY